MKKSICKWKSESVREFNERARIAAVDSGTAHWLGVGKRSGDGE